MWALRGLLLAAFISSSATPILADEVWSLGGFKEPESALFDPQRNIIYVSNIAAWINAFPPVATEHYRFQPEAHRHGSPEVREVTRLEHENRIARRQSVHQRGFPGSSPGRRIDHDRPRTP